MSQRVAIIIAVIVFFIITIALGIYSTVKSRKLSAKDFFTAGGNVNWFVNGICVFAAFNSGGALMGNFGTAYAGGWGFQVTANAGAAVGMLVATFFVAKPLRNMRIATVGEYFRKRYDSKFLNTIIPVLFVLAMLAYVVAQMKVGGMLGEKILGIPYAYGLIIMTIIYVSYTAYGGMLSVTLTSLFQGLVMIFVLVLGSILSIKYFGGFGELYDSAITLRPTWSLSSNPKFPWVSFFGAFLTWVFAQSCLPHTIMRVFTSKNERDGRRGLSFGSLLIAWLAALALICITAAAVVINNGADLPQYDYVFMNVIDTIFPLWFQAITYAGVFAAVLSSVSGQLLSIGSNISYDLINTHRPGTPDKTVRNVNTYSVMVFGVIAAIIALNPPQLLTVLYASAMGLLTSSVALPLLLGLWWKKMNKQGAIAGCIAGSIAFFYAFLFMEMTALSQVIIGFPVALIVSIVVSLMTAPSTEKEMYCTRVAHERVLTDEELIEFAK